MKVNNFLTLDGIVLLHLCLVVVIQTVDSLSLHVVSLVGLSVDCSPHLLQSLFCHLGYVVSSFEGEKTVFLYLVRTK